MKHPARMLVPVAMLFATLAAIAGEYQHPVVVIPYAWKKPVIDGVVNDAEWSGAFSQCALQTVNKQISTRQTQFWMMWDEDNIYVAMRSPLRPGERVIQDRRGPDSDPDVIFDDCFEILGLRRRHRSADRAAALYHAVSGELFRHPL